MNINDLVPEFRLADAKAYLEKHPFEQLGYQSRFPEKYTSDLSWRQIESNTGAKVAADIVAFNSRSPRKGRPTPGKAFGEIPKIEIARDKTETDFNTYRKLQNDLRLAIPGSRDSVAQQLVEWIYGDTTFVADGVRAKLELMSKQVASRGGYTLDILNNAAGVQGTIEVDFGIPTVNKLKMAAANRKWSVPATSDPIADFKRVRDEARKKGKILKYATMDMATFENMVQSAALQKFTASYVAVSLNLTTQPSLEQVNSALTRAGLPSIVIWESYITLEDKAGDHDVVSGWEPGNVTFTVGAQIGEVQYTLSADEFVKAGVAEKMKSGIVLVKSWAEEDPITVITKGVAYASPVLNDTNGTFILSTELN